MLSVPYALQRRRVNTHLQLEPITEIDTNRFNFSKPKNDSAILDTKSPRNIDRSSIRKSKTLKNQDLDNSKQVIDDLVSKILIERSEEALQRENRFASLKILTPKPYSVTKITPKHQELSKQFRSNQNSPTKENRLFKKVTLEDILTSVDESSQKIQLQKSSSSLGSSSESNLLFKNTKASFFKFNPSHVLSESISQMKNPSQKNNVFRDSNETIIVRIGLLSHIIQPKFMNHKGSMCLTELWPEKMKLEYFQQKTREEKAKVIRFDEEKKGKLNILDGLYRPDKLFDLKKAMTKAQQLNLGYDSTMKESGEHSSNGTNLINALAEQHANQKMKKVHETEMLLPYLSTSVQNQSVVSNLRNFSSAATVARMADKNVDYIQNSSAKLMSKENSGVISLSTSPRNSKNNSILDYIPEKMTNFDGDKVTTIARNTVSTEIDTLTREDLETYNPEEQSNLGPNTMILTIENHDKLDKLSGSKHKEASSESTLSKMSQRRSSLRTQKKNEDEFTITKSTKATKEILNSSGSVDETDTYEQKISKTTMFKPHPPPKMMYMPMNTLKFKPYLVLQGYTSKKSH